MDYCFNKCNTLYKNTLDPQRIYCKKGCSSDFEVDECKLQTCSKICIKEELGTDEAKWGSWSKVFSRAPAESANCLEACFNGCVNKIAEDDK
jgi:hypothetical protein